jgi:hypothetical protein
MRIGTGLRLVAMTVLLLAVNGITSGQQNVAPTGTSDIPPLKLSSAAFSDSTPYPHKYTCIADPNVIKRGLGTSPPLQWSEVPPNTAIFVLIFHDLEPRLAKSSEDYVHWIMWNLPGTARELPEGIPPNPELPDGTRQGHNDGGQVGYRAPCAGPSLPHHYTFELFAVDQKLDLAPTATRADVLKAINGHTLGHAVLIGLFHR